MFNAFIPFDGAVCEWVSANLHPGSGGFWDAFFTFVTHLGDGGVFWIVLALLLLIPKQTRKAGIIMAIALILDAVIVNGLLKHIFARPRPFDVDWTWRTYHYIFPDLIKTPTDFSFPSGHTAAAFAGAIGLWLGLRKPYAAAGVILAALIGFSRIYVGVHYATDVLAGLVAGAVCAAAAYIIVLNIRVLREN
ncbi:phosphatase PAP2 family protein [Clostridia bacterium]|nr:phosphatase PAP2 family protein [Clostridia bacterium]